MKYYLKENFRFLYADGQLYDDNGDIAYEYRNQTLMFPRVELYRYGRLIGYIKKRFSWLLSRYDIYHNDRFIDSISQRLTFFRSELTVEGLNWTIKGDFLSWHYSIYNEYDELIATADQEILRLTQRFYIDIFDEDNEELIMLLILTINQFDKDRQAAAASSGSAASHN